MKKRIAGLVALCLAACLALSGCITVEGVEQLLEALGASSSQVEEAPEDELDLDDLLEGEEPEAQPQPDEPAPPPASGSISIRGELLGLLGKTNAELKALQGAGGDCQVIYGGTAYVDYSQNSVAYPLVFWLEGDQDEMLAALQAGKGSDGSFPTTNIFPDHFTVWSVIGWGELISKHIFLSDEPLTEAALNAAFGQQPELEHTPAYEGADTYFEFDTWRAVYTYGDYQFSVVYQEENGAKVPFTVQIFPAESF